MAEPFDTISLDEVIVNTEPQTLVKLSGPVAELNIVLSEEEIEAVRELASRVEGTVTAGSSAGSRTHWVLAEEGCHILIGEDQWTWDIGFLCSLDLLVSLKEQLAQPS
ncbi:MAG: hypothetical protein Q4D96_06940 [Propionibacteriaceae bacterium]|nr:hypothetical protein [Propionibacteriaceae bacterium]